MDREQRNWTRTGIGAGVVILLLLIPFFVDSFYYLHTLIITLIYTIAACSLRTILLSGQISIAHAAFMGLGAYVSAILAKELAWTPWLTIPLGGLAALVVGVLAGVPLTRVRAIYFSMVSLFIGLALVALMGVFADYTGGDIGLIGIPPLPAIAIPGLPEVNFLSSKIPCYYFFLLLTLLCLLILHSLENSRVGMRWKAIAQSHLVASSVGINEAGFRVLALAVGCFFAGIAGAGYAHYNMVLTRSSFGFLSSVNLLIYVLVGGATSFFGPIVGTVVLVIVPETFRWMKTFTPFVFGGIMLLVVFFMPHGIAGLFDQLKNRFFQKDETERSGNVS
ncbi:MAG: branched-chain amino acid ABC transporter permease [Deltaproteobacteria bacterium]|nr:branched-chain amino acid ABC transporter permease [Deltaproteobacteria bacterium]